MTAPAKPIATSGAPNAAAPDTTVNADEADLFRLATQIPGLGGLYFDESGKLVAYLTQLSTRGDAERAAARSALQARLTNHRRSGHAPAAGALGPVDVIFRGGEYDLMQLRRWRDGSRLHIFAVPEVRFLDLDEAKNRIAVGVHSTEIGTAGPAVVRAAAAAGVPAGAITIVPVSDAHVASASLDARVLGTRTDARNRVSLPRLDAGASGPTLSDFYRPVMGGMYTRAAYGCAVGFNAQFDGIMLFVTHTECSQTSWSSDVGTSYGAAGERLGYESMDPAGGAYLCRGFSGVCRQSAAALVRYDSPSDAGFGQIAHTTGGSSGYTGIGSKVINTSAPALTITGTEHGVYVGDVLDKVGPASGWTWGNVDRTCVHWFSGMYSSEGYALYYTCQHHLRYAEDRGGDMGAPVFRYNPDGTAILYGMVNFFGYYDYCIQPGCYYTDPIVVYSGYRSIEADLGVQDQGRLVTFTASPPPPPPDDPCVTNPSAPGCGPCGGPIMCSRARAGAQALGASPPDRSGDRARDRRRGRRSR